MFSRSVSDSESVFEENSVSENESVVDFVSNNVFAKISNEILTIVSSLPMTDVSVYDLSGRLVMKIKVNNQNETTNEFLFAEGIYIVKIKMINGTITSRKLVNK